MKKILIMAAFFTFIGCVDVSINNDNGFKVIKEHVTLYKEKKIYNYILRVDGYGETLDLEIRCNEKMWDVGDILKLKKIENNIK